MLPYIPFIWKAISIAKKRKVPIIGIPLIHLGEPSNDEISRMFISEEKVKVIKYLSKNIVTNFLNIGIKWNNKKTTGNT